MLRGHRSIYISLFPDEKQNTDLITAPAERKGRSEMLILKRNELLISRYYYYVKMCGKQYPATLEVLEEELFIAQRTIVNIIDENRDILKHFLKEKPEIKFFKNKFPFYNWQYSTTSN